MTTKKIKFLKNSFLCVRKDRTHKLYNEDVERGCGL